MNLRWLSGEDRKPSACSSCGKQQDECDAEQAAIQEQNERGSCEFGPDCDGTLCKMHPVEYEEIPDAIWCDVCGCTHEPEGDGISECDVDDTEENWHTLYRERKKQ